MKLIELLLEEENDGIQAISLVSEPAIEENWVALSDVKLKAIDNDRRIVMGAALVPNKPIFRRNGEDEFYIYFSEDTIRKAAEGYLKAGHQKQSNLEHEMAITGVTTVESWIVEDSQIDKSAVYGFKYDKGTWVVTMKIDNDAVWDDFIKTGRLKGFSIEGKFTQRMDGSSAPAELASYADYPDAVKNNAQRGIELNEKQGNKCATQVGKVRAQQLAQGEAVSVETIERMYSYLSRAEEYYDEGNTEACGTISYLLWGGKAGLRWATRKLKELDRLEMVEQNPGEADADFISRCMSELAGEFPDEAQRYAVCRSYMEMEEALSDLEKEIS